jgi:hypothetical protein
MIWVLEEIIWFRKHDLNINNDRGIRRGPARCGRKKKVILKSDKMSYG